MKPLWIAIGLMLGATLATGGDAPTEESVRALLGQGKIAEAVAAARELLLEVEGAAGPRSLAAARALDLLAVGLRRTGTAGRPEAKELALRAIEIKEAELGPEHAELFSSLSTLAGLLIEDGRAPEAKPLWERSLSIKGKEIGPESAELASILNGLGMSLHRNGAYDDAVAIFEQAIGIFGRQFGPDHHWVSTPMSNMALVKRDLGYFAEARELLQRSLEIKERAVGPDQPDYLLIAQTLDNLAGLNHELGFYAEARQLHERVLTLREQTLGVKHWLVAQALNNLAMLLAAMGSYDEAKPLLERALDINQRAAVSEHPHVSAILSSLGRLHYEMGQHPEALRYLERASEIEQRQLGAPTGGTLQELALVRSALGTFDEATRTQELVLGIVEKRAGTDHPDYARALEHLARLQWKTSSYDEAGRTLERSLGIFERAFGPEHPVVARVLSVLARARARAGDGAGALASALRAEAIGRDHLRRTIHALPEQQSLAYAATRPEGLDLILSLVAAKNERLEKQAWDVLVRARTLVLDELAGRRHALRDAGDPEAAALQEALSASSRRYANLIVRGPGRDRPEIYRRLLDDVRRERDRAEEALAAGSVAFRESRASERIGIDEVVTHLPERAALVGYVRYEREPLLASEPTTSYLAFVQRQGSQRIRAVPLGTAKEIDALVAAWIEQAAGGTLLAGGSVRDAERAYRAAGVALRRAVWDPIAAAMGGAERVFVIPDGQLSLVSFAALPRENGAYLIEGGPTLHFLSAERDLVPRAAPAAPDGELLALGGIAYDAVGSRPAEAAGPSYRGNLSSCVDFPAIRFSALPATAVEVDEVASLWVAAQERAQGGPEAVARLTGTSASEAAFKKLAPGHRVLHLATHGFFLGERCPSALGSVRGIGGLAESVETVPPPRGENPLQLAGLALAGANLRDSAAADQEDGVLTAEEVAALDLSSVEWAVLSACDTGVGRVVPGEGVSGLRRAFRVAGVRTVIMSLWSVEDDSTRAFMKSLYDARLRRRLDTTAAVREAGLAVLHERRRAGRSEHPFYWAAFVAAGEWR